MRGAFEIETAAFAPEKSELLGRRYSKWIDRRLEAEAVPDGPGTYYRASDYLYALPCLSDVFEDEALVAALLARAEAEAREAAASHQRKARRTGSYRILVRLGLLAESPFDRGDADAGH